MPKQNGMAIDVDTDDLDHIKTFEGLNGLKVGGVFVLDQMHVQQVCPADTNKNTLYSLLIPAGLIQKNDSLEIAALFSFGTGSANGKIMRCEFNGLSDIFYGHSITNATYLSYEKFRFLRNRNSLANQVTHGSWSELGVSTSAVLTKNIDFSIDQTMTISGQKAVAGDTIALESVIVKLLRGVN